jgi:hypothetical protein
VLSVTDLFQIFSILNSKQMSGTAFVYFEVAAIITPVLLGQIIVKAKANTPNQWRYQRII